MDRPFTIKLIRHGESQSNIGAFDHRSAGDHTVSLTDRGIEQARAAAMKLPKGFFNNCLIYRSPYQRTRQTLDILLESAGISNPRIYEDVRLREVDHGYDNIDEQQEARFTHGFLYYRYKGGESPADCMDRHSTFLETFMRQVARKRPDTALFCSHGISSRCFVTRYLHLSPEQFDSMQNPDNCAIVTISNDPAQHDSPVVFTCGAWGVSGLRLR
jgi:broad specificity phosphatase PhoE